MDAINERNTGERERERWTEHATTSLDHDANTEKDIFNHQKIIN